MSWYQPDDCRILFHDRYENGGCIGDLYFREKIKLCLWNYFLPTWVRLRLVGSRFHQWIIA